MKATVALLLILFIFINGKCRKDKIDYNVLPPVTQTGKSTLGFMLNGQVWTPQGFNGTANLSIDVDFGFNNGVFGISAYKILSDNDRTYFGIGLKDSLNSTLIPSTFQLTNQSLYGVHFLMSPCSFYSSDLNTTVSGSLTITELDKTNRIIAGTFSAKLIKSGCQTIEITDGRFDMKY